MRFEYRVVEIEEDWGEDVRESTGRFEYDAKGYEFSVFGFVVGVVDSSELYVIFSGNGVESIVDKSFDGVGKGTFKGFFFGLFEESDNDVSGYDVFDSFSGLSDIFVDNVMYRKIFV